MNAPLMPAQATRLSLVLIVDDHPFFSEGMSLALCRSGWTQRVEIAESVAEAKRKMTETPEIDLILLDLSLPDAPGLTLIHNLNEAGLPIPVVVVSSREDEGAVRAARAAGAQGFLPKSADRGELQNVLHAIVQGDLWFPDLAPTPLEPGHPLTPRQLEVLRLLASGLPNKRICHELGLTEHTVKSHLKAIFGVLQVHNRTECVLLAREMGLVD